MSSSGRKHWFGKSKPDELRKLIREIESGAKDAQFEAEVSEKLGVKLAAYNARDTQEIGNVLSEVSKELGDELESAIELRFGGSVSKNTFVKGLSDIDALVLLKPTTTTELSPSDLKDIFADRLTARFGANNIKKGELAVTVTVKGHEIQLLPSLRHGEHFKISSHDGLHWSTIRPRVFVKQLTDANGAMDGKLVPTIKLAKAIIAGFPQQRQISGYHCEVLAVTAFTGYTGDKSPKQMLTHFFEKLPELVRSPMRDVTGQSTYVDEYLGQGNSIQRAVVADACDQIRRQIRNADGAKSPDRWMELFPSLE